MVFALLFTAFAFGADCTLAQVNAVLDKQDSSLRSKNRWSELQTQLEQELACLTEPLTPHIAYRIHIARGRAAFYQRELDLARAEWANARLLEPYTEVDPLFFVRGGAMESVLFAAEESPQPAIEMSPSTQLVDGHQTRMRMVGLPQLVQPLGGGIPLVTALDGGSKRTGKGKVAMLLTGTTLAAGGGVLWGMAVDKRAQYMQAQELYQQSNGASVDELIDMKRSTNTMGGLGVGGVGVGLALLTVGITR